ncbi:uncharacterized protein L3040_005999 [Drepanopeziza brunnea f. sp. 'multigermtubi']|uniref:uncharacterized protein n=1 Tax=Drepanopeziza brunnea f. sp. 'multigermtubi' TaxID=698441 RepID=UPI002394B76F|nr:hypothetical protein L3040_005999 [Drepanopeziza brunnea f. sp. 'multigermtubi']
MSPFSFREIMDVIPAGTPFIFQLYFYTDRAEKERILTEVGKYKPQAILFTVDLPVMSEQEAPPRQSLIGEGKKQAQLAHPTVNIDWSCSAWIKQKSGALVFVKGIPEGS